MTQIIVIQNSSKLLSDEALSPILAAIRIQLNEHVRAFWPTLDVVDLQAGLYAPARGVWGAILQDGSPIPADLGYHDKESGEPVARIDVQASLRINYSVSSVLSHELCEMYVDPYVSNTVSGPWGDALAEICDPFIMPYMDYRIGEVDVANFTTDAYWQKGDASRLDMKGMLNPSQIFPYMPEGGYAMVRPPGGAWGLKTAPFRTRAVSVEAAEEAARRATQSARCRHFLAGVGVPSS